MDPALSARADLSGSQTVKTLLGLRDLVLTGALQPGQRISELAIVERLGVSRTPVRAALARLQEEGLVELIPSGGYAVRAFSERDIIDAIELRGTLEGLAARFAAERGVGSEGLATLKDTVAELDVVVGRAAVTDEGFSAYVRANERFHAILVELAGSPTLARQIERAVALPFASPSAFVMAQSAVPEVRTILTVAQEQHRAVVEAIEGREGARAEAIMREHARVAFRNLQLALRDQRAWGLIPGASLVRLKRSA